jgi:hypothetical protein
MPDAMETASANLLDRREFTLQLVIAILSGATITVVPACGGGGSPSSPSPNPGSGDVTGTITANHGHTARITAAQLSAGNELTLNITGQADHPHTVQLSGAQIMQIASRQRVSVESTNDAAHTHTVTFN